MEITSSYIHLHNLRFHAFHGVLAQEQVVGNDYVVSVRICLPLAFAVDSDDLSDTMNYADAYNIIRCEMVKPVKLLEHLAGNIVKSLIEAFPLITSVDINLTKENPPIGADCDGAGVELHVINVKN